MTPTELIKIAGGPTKVARAVNRSHTTVILWKKIPPHHILALEEALGIPREQLRPDLYQKQSGGMQICTSPTTTKGNKKLS